MATIRYKQSSLLVLFMVIALIHIIQGDSSEEEEGTLHLIEKRQACPNPAHCRSKWDYCGTGDPFCGEGCKGGPCQGGGGGGGGGGGDGSVISEQAFACAFNTIDGGTRASRFSGLKGSGWNPSNKDEAAVFLAHVFHETDGLKVIREYCAPGCGPNYAQSWCGTPGAGGKYYYGRGWFQLSYPCNYLNAGKALGLDLLNNPQWVEERQDLAVKTAVWFYTANNMAGPAQRGDFAATTRIINGPRECSNGPGYSSQLTRVATYKRIRHCFGLGEPGINPVC